MFNRTKPQGMNGPIALSAANYKQELVCVLKARNMCPGRCRIASSVCVCVLRWTLDCYADDLMSSGLVLIPLTPHSLTCSVNSTAPS